MSKAMTVRFYRVGKVSPQGPSFRQALQAIWNLGQASDREKQLTGGLICRLERLTLTEGFVAGEMMRLRETDLPCEVHPDGTRALGVDVPIGDGVAFCFREQDHTLAIHYDQRVVSPGRFNDYIAQSHFPGKFTMDPVVDPQALERFRAQPLRKVKVKLARPHNLGALENEMSAAGQAFQDLGAAYDAPIITIEMSMGHNRGQLANGAKTMVEGFLAMAGLSGDVRGISVTPDAGEGEENEDINLLDTLLSEKGEVAPASEEPDAVYAATSSFVRARLNAHA